MEYDRRCSAFLYGKEYISVGVDRLIPHLNEKTLLWESLPHLCRKTDQVVRKGIVVIAWMRDDPMIGRSVA